MASGGYPEAYSKGCVIEGLDTQIENTIVYHCGTRFFEGDVITNGGRLSTTQGGTFIWPMIVMSNLAQGSAALGVFYMTRNARDKSMASTSAISAYFGITEPAMFGVNLRFKFPFYAALLGSALGSIFLSLNKVQASAIGVGGLPGFISIVPSAIPMFVIGMVVAMVVPFALTCMLSMKIVRPGYRVA